MFVSVRMQFRNHVDQGSQTRGPRTACGPRGRFVRPAGADTASNVRGGAISVIFGSQVS